MSEAAGRLDILPAALSRPTSVRWRILALLLAFSFMSWLNRVSMSVAYDERIKTELRISEQEIGWVYSALLFAYMLFMTPGGWFADRCGSRLALAVMGLGSAAFVAGTGAVGFAALPVAGTVAALLVVRAAMGVFTAPIYPGSGHAIARWFPAAQRAAANGAVMAAALLGIASSYYAFGTLLDLLDWPGAFLVTSGLTALFALLWVWYARDFPAAHRSVNPAELHAIAAARVVLPPVLPEEAITSAGPPPRRPPVGDATRKLAAYRSLILLTLSYAAIGYFEYLFYFWMHFYFDDTLKLGKDRSRLYSTILFVAMAAGMFLGGWLADGLARAWGRRAGRAAVVVGGMLCGAAFLGLGLLASEPDWIVVWFALALAAVGATEGPFWATAIELGGRYGATAAGVFNTGGNAGGALAPVLTPVVMANFGWPWAIGVGSLVCLAGACLWVWIDQAEQRPESASSRRPFAPVDSEPSPPASSADGPPVVGITRRTPDA